MKSIKTMNTLRGDKLVTMGVDCDECGKLFGIDNYELEREGSDVIEHRFDCPHCKHSYLSYLTTKEVRDNQERQQTLKRHIRALKGTNAKEEKVKEIDRLTETNKKLMDELKDEDGMWI